MALTHRTYESDSIKELLTELVKKLEEKGQLMPGADKTKIVENVMTTLKEGGGDFKFNITHYDNAATIKGLSSMLIEESISEKFPGLKINIPKLVKDLPDLSKEEKLQLQMQLKTLFKLAIETKLKLKLGRNLNEQELDKVNQVADRMADNIVNQTNSNEMLKENNDTNMTLLMILAMTLKDLAKNNPQELTERSLNAGMDPNSTGGIQQIVTEIRDLSLNRTIQTQGLNEAMSVLEELKRFDFDRPGGLEAVALNNATAMDMVCAEIVQDFESLGKVPSTTPQNVR